MAARTDGARLDDVSTTRASSLKHVRPAQPLRFPEQEPESERMGQGRRHRHLCDVLYRMLRAVCVPEHTVGADQFVYFDAANPKRFLAPPGERLRVWDRLEHDLVERVVVDDTTPCVTLSLTLVVGPVLVDPDDGYPVALRLARDTEGRDLILTAEERFRAERKAKDLEAAGRVEEAAGRQRAEERVAELEKTLAAKGRRT